MVLVLVFLASLIPSAAIFFWLRNQKNMREGFADKCTKALIYGAVCTLAVVVLSATFALVGRLSGLHAASEAFYQVYYKFIVLAFAEELCKFLAMKRLTRGAAYSWFEYTVFMTIVGIGFEVIEAIPYAIGAGPMVMLVRGGTLMHGGFGFIMGYFYGKSKSKGNKAFAVLGFMIAWLLHGAYDYFLTEDIILIDGEIAGLLALAIAAFAIVLIVILIVFVIRRRGDERYITVADVA